MLAFKTEIGHNCHVPTFQMDINTYVDILSFEINFVTLFHRCIYNWGLDFYISLFKDKKPIIIDINDGGMKLQINSQLGSMKEDIDIQKEGKDILIGFNPKFLIDALRVIDDEIVTLYMVNPKAPCFIKDEKESYTYLILPVNFNNAAR